MRLNNKAGTIIKMSWSLNKADVTFNEDPFEKKNYISLKAEAAESLP